MDTDWQMLRRRTHRSVKCTDINVNFEEFLSTNIHTVYNKTTRLIRATTHVARCVCVSTIQLARGGQQDVSR